MDIFIQADSLISLYFFGVSRFIDDFSNSPFVFSEKYTEDKDIHNLIYSIISVSVLSPLNDMIDSNNHIYILPVQK